jgi:hypothetical protein
MQEIDLNQLMTVISPLSRPADMTAAPVPVFARIREGLLLQPDMAILEQCQ